MPENEAQWCFAWFAGEDDSDRAARAALVKKAKWPKNATISVSFLDGDPDIQQAVKRVAQMWTVPGMANLHLDFRNTTDTLIRISLQYEGSWSVIGTTCRQITDRHQPTMNYGWLRPGSAQEEIQRVVLHEFGHALGLIHEHQNPAGGIQWNKPQVYRDLSGPPNNWPRDVIDHNMFETYAARDTNFTNTDPQSIMMYPIPKSWTLNGFSVGLNGTLSDTDKKFIRGQYPQGG